MGIQTAPQARERREEAQVTTPAQPSGESGWVIAGTIASILTLAVTIYLAVREGIARRRQRRYEIAAALEGLDRELRDLGVDAQRAINSVLATVPGIPGFRLRVDAIAAHLAMARNQFTAEQQSLLDHLLRQATDANRAMDTGQASADGTFDRVRQYELVTLKASHLFAANEHKVTDLQRAQNAVIAARRKLRAGSKS
jgi:hypothetical protein